MHVSLQLACMHSKDLACASQVIIEVGYLQVVGV